MSSQPKGATKGGRTAVAAIIGFLAAIITLVTPLGVWLKYEVADTDQFVAATAPLASDSALRSKMITDLTDAIPEGFEAVTGGAGALLIGTALTNVTATPAFARGWEASVREAHQQGLGVLEGTGTTDDENVALKLGPLINSAKESMIESGIGAAKLIPDVDAQLTVAETSKFVQAKDGYRLAMLVGTWGPWAALALWALTILIAPRKGAAFGWLGFVLMLAAGLSFVAITVGGGVVNNAMAGTQLPETLISAAYGALGSAANAGLAMVAGVGLLLLLVGMVVSRRQRRS